MSAVAVSPLPTRQQRIDQLTERELDVLVVGGGITGAGIAHDLALRGLRVAVVERGDWAGSTSSASSRLVHGGLRYLEQLEIGLVRDACLERGLLLSNASGLVWPEQFCFPVHKNDAVGLWKLAAGLGLYTLVSIPRQLGLPRILSSRAVRKLVPGIATDGLRGGGLYMDGATDDSRLTLAVVATAIEDGAIALSRFEATSIEDGANGIEAGLVDLLSGETLTVKAKTAVLAGGPFTDELRGRAALEGGWLAPTRGTHIVVPRQKLPTDGAVIFTSAVDGRVMFLIPWPRCTVIGTTDIDCSPDAEIQASREEVQYLLDSANALVPSAGLNDTDVLSSWAGLRPLLRAQGKDPSERSREERIEHEGNLWTIGGGKLTAYRSMAETLGARLAEDLGIGLSDRRSPTRSRKLRGASTRPAKRPAWSRLGSDRRPASGRTPLVHAWQRRYVGLAPAVDEVCRALEGGRVAFDPETLAGEVDWAVGYEDCLSAVDFFLRRTDLGHGSNGTLESVQGAVVERMAQLLGWSGEESSEQIRVLRAALAARDSWRNLAAAKSA